MATTQASTSAAASPQWLLEAENTAQSTPLWQVLTEDIYIRMEQRLHRQGLGQFSDLSEAEQIALVAEIQRSLISDSDTTYAAFEQQLGRIMDDSIATEAQNRMRATDAAASARDPAVAADDAFYLQQLLATAGEGAVATLQQLPLHHREALKLMLNQPIPASVRADMWRLLLKDRPARSAYEKLCRSAPGRTISPQDVAITQVRVRVCVRVCLNTMRYWNKRSEHGQYSLRFDPCCILSIAAHCTMTSCTARVCHAHLLASEITSG